MYTEAELHIAKICVKNNFLSATQLEECLQASNLEPVGSPNTLGQIMISRNFITLPQLQQAQRAQAYEQTRRYDKLFGEICLHKKFVSTEVIEECLEDQKNAYVAGEIKILRLQDLLLERNFLSRAQLMEVMSEFLKRKGEATIKMKVKSALEEDEEIEEQDLVFGKLAAKNRMVTENQFNEVLKLYKLARETGHPRSVQALLEEKGYLSPVQSQVILRTINYTNWRKQDKTYAEIAVSLELATERQVKEILELQKSNYMQNKPEVVRLLDELIARSLITQEESESILKHERRNGIRQEISSIRTTGTFPAVRPKKKSSDSSSSSFLNVVPKKEESDSPSGVLPKPKTTRLSLPSKITTSSAKLKAIGSGGSSAKLKALDSKDLEEEKMPCPFCKKKIHPRAKKCKHCGYYLV